MYCTVMCSSVMERGCFLMLYFNFILMYINVPFTLNVNKKNKNIPNSFFFSFFYVFYIFSVINVLFIKTKHIIKFVILSIFIKL